MCFVTAGVLTTVCDVFCQRGERVAAVRQRAPGEAERAQPMLCGLHQQPGEMRATVAAAGWQDGGQARHVGKSSTSRRGACKSSTSRRGACKSSTSRRGACKPSTSRRGTCKLSTSCRGACKPSTSRRGA